MADVSITDHALIRWLERAHGIEVEELREILREQAQRHVDAGAALVFEDGDSCWHGTVDDIDDVVTFAAVAPEGLEQAFRESVDDWHEFQEARRRG